MENIISYFIEFITSLLIKFLNIISSPILNILNRFIPNLNDFFTIFKNVFDNFFINGFRFFKMLYINMFGINHTVFLLCGACFAISLAIYVQFNAIKLVYNLWRIYRGTHEV